MGALIYSGISLNTAYAGCAGDCMTCHQKLVGSKEHNSLTACIKCHDPAKNISIVTQSGEGCGNNCFDCHNQWPKDGYHADLDTCKNCHKG